MFVHGWTALASRKVSVNRIARSGLWALVWCAASVAAPCWAATWDLITVSDQDLVRFYVDPASVRKQGSVRRARLLFDYKQVQQDPDTLIEHRSTVEVASIDCGHHRLAPIEATSYAGNMGQGAAVVVNEAVAESRLRYVDAAAGSIDDKVVSFVCALGARPRQSQ